jgi:hypothetical protein
MHLLTHKLERLGDGHHIVNTGSDLQSFYLMAAPAAHSGDDRAFGAARDMRVVSGFANAIDHVLDLIFSRFFGHVDDHGWILLVQFSGKTKAAIFIAAYGFSWFRVAVRGSSESKLRRSRVPAKSVVHGKGEAWSKSFHRISSALSKPGRELLGSSYCSELATLENALFAFEPIKRTVPTTRTRMTASMTAYSAISCPSSSDQSLRMIWDMVFSSGPL